MARVTTHERMLIGGELVVSESGLWDDSINPATEEVIGRVPSATAEDVARAAAAAEAAWPAWSAMPVSERAEQLREFGRRLLARAEEILHVEVADTGNTITPMRGDVRMAVESLNYYAGLAHEVKGETFPATPDKIHFTLREPYGVVARIVPFNHPLMFAVARTAAALASGNAVIVKPPETSPLSAMVLADIARDALPAGIFNIITGPGRTAGDALVRHPAIKRIAFIGSTVTGRAIQRSAADAGVKHVTLELGGKNPMIVFPDADVDAVAKAAVGGMNFTWQGQSCGSTSRLLLHEDIHDAVVERVAARVADLRVGDPSRADTDMGPINSADQLRKVVGFIEDGRREGARLLAGGEPPAGAEFQRGFWVRPTVFADVRPQMRLWREEVFGPILSVGRWRSLEEAITLANSTEFGLTAAIWTNDIKNALNTAKRVRSGHIWINGFGSHYLGVPFGGMKNSGIGREEGIEELLSYTETKTINVIL
ncbi:aldehyde dehydrogenase family protein [Bradyrhizobium prioriisuperbiae]|uniref:aldehyde dehydrogenase family protein n=1 Tax=Bradyrhizobium prioriisuperbiae TaxID=2854389 RepID=UPI0028EFE503|nr:aldehyde dehydrogenase family protein [Bradyrhizobium prioritasuperba]